MDDLAGSTPERTGRARAVRAAREPVNAPAPSPGPIDVRDLGRVAYAEAWELQDQLVDARYRGEVEDTLLVCEHDPVVTTGRATADDERIPGGRFPVVAVERGGEATYHGPGQIVVYPIVHLAPHARDLHRWMRALEEACILTLADVGLASGRRPGATGVWLDDGKRKVVSIGVAARRWVTWHGLALNHETDLEHFTAIRPCGFDAAVMTSAAQELGASCPSRARLTERLVERLGVELAPFRKGSAGSGAGGG